MSRSRRKKKHRPTKWDAEENQRVTVSGRHSYNQGVDTQGPPPFGPMGPPGQLPAGPPAFASRGEIKDGHDSLVHSPGSELELQSQVRVFSLDNPPRGLHLISEWLARDAIARGEATLLRTSARVRGIQYVAKTQPDPVTPEKPCVLRTNSIGDVHSHDTELNPAGVYTFYPFPPGGPRLDRFILDVFRTVLNSCKEKAAGKIAL